MTGKLRRMATNLKFKFIIGLLFCMAILAGICPETDNRYLRPAQEGVNVICAPASDRDVEIVTRETLGQSGSLRAQYRLSETKRTVRNLQVVYLLSTAILPGFFLCVCKLSFEFGERKISPCAFIIRFIHDLDGSKWALA